MKSGSAAWSSGNDSKIPQMIHSSEAALCGAILLISRFSSMVTYIRIPTAAPGRIFIERRP